MEIEGQKSQSWGSGWDLHFSQTPTEEPIWFRIVNRVLQRVKDFSCAASPLYIELVWANLFYATLVSPSEYLFDHFNVSVIDAFRLLI